MRPYVLVGDGEVGVRTVLCQGLRAEGMDVRSVDDGPSAFLQAISGAFDVIVLAVDLAGLSGYEVVIRLRGAGVDTPVLLISANDSETEQAKGLDLGADGYLVKPLSLLVMLAQVKALLRRRAAHVGDPGRRLQVGDLILEPATKTAIWKRCSIGLSPREYTLLHALLTRQGTVVSKPELKSLVWDGEVAVTANAVVVYVGYVRRKLEAIGAVDVVRTVHGHGYQVTVPVEDPEPAQAG